MFGDTTGIFRPISFFRDKNTVTEAAINIAAVAVTHVLSAQNSSVSSTLSPALATLWIKGS